MKRYPFGMLLFMVLQCARAEGLPPGIGNITANDIRQSFLAFVNLTTTPGLEGSLLTIDTDNRNSELWRSSLGFAAEFTLKDPIFNGYWGAAIVAGGLNDELNINDDFGAPVTLKIDRDITALRGSFGLSFPITHQFKVRPYASLVLSSAETRTNATGQIFNTIQNDNGDQFVLESQADSVSGIATLNLMYQNWINTVKYELSGQINSIYTDAYSEDNDALNTWSWSETLLGKIRLSGNTGWKLDNRNWEWNTYYSYNNYFDHSKSALGFRYINEIGVGLDWDLHIKPMDWFGWRYLGVRAGYSFGDDVSGFNIGLSAR